jgi:hypothetical protein
MPASGKLAIASLLAREMGYMLIDNHYFHDFVRPFTEHRSDWGEDYFELIADLRRDFLNIVSGFYPRNRAVKYVFTGMLFHNWRGFEMFCDIQSFAQNIGADFVPVEFRCRDEVLRARVGEGDRASRGKIASVAKLERVIGGRSTLQVDHPSKLVLDTSDATAQEGFERIRTHLDVVGLMGVWRKPPACDPEGRRKEKVR